jgi:hypothetical protein
MQMTVENTELEKCGNMPAMQKVLRKEHSQDDTMPLLKDKGIKNSLPMQLPMPHATARQRRVSTALPNVEGNPLLKGIALYIFTLMSDHYVWFVDYWLEVW